MRSFVLMLIFLVIAGSLWYYIKFERGASSTNKEGKKNDNSEGFPLEVGDKGGDVSRAQLYMNIVHDTGLAVNGFYDKATKKAVKQITGNNVLTTNNFNTLREKTQAAIQDQATYNKWLTYLNNLNFQSNIWPDNKEADDAFSGFGGDSTDFLEAARNWGIYRSRYVLNNPDVGPKYDISLYDFLKQ